MSDNINYFDIENIKQQLHNNINIELPYESVFSLPFLKKNNGKLMETMFIYRDVPDGCEDGFLRRPYSWIVVSMDGRVILYGDCSYVDFIDTEKYPFDMQIFAKSENIESIENYSEKYNELFDEYKILKTFAFKELEKLSDYELACIERFVKLFKDIVYIGHYPFYKALSPEFFEWIGLEEKGSDNLKNITDTENFIKEENTESTIKINPEVNEEPVKETTADIQDKDENYIYVDISEVTEKLDVLENLFNERISYDEYKEKLFDNMHKELQSYKNGFFNKITETLELDIIKVIDDVSRSVSAYRDKNPTPENYMRLLAVFEGLEIDLKDVLYRQNIESFNVAGEIIDVTRQKIVSVINTDEKEKDKKLCRRITPGYEKNGQVLRPEKITAYVYKDKRT